MKLDFNVQEYKIAKFKNIIRCSVRKVIGHKNYTRKIYNNKKIGNMKYANQEIKKGLSRKGGFLAARFGDTELRAMMYTIEIKLGIRNEYPKYILEKMDMNAGFFPATQDNLFRFGELMIESCRKVDFYGVWFNLMEDFVIRKFSPNANITKLEFLEPYRYKEPWSKELEGKKVLVIHPFEDSIIEQYKRRKDLFKNKDVLPTFELKTIKAIQSNGGGETNFNNWFEALDYMYSESKKIDYDIAIVGCGAYGLPLSSKLKEDGKKVIHLAGATQILFGIRGARWDVRPEMQELFNENWIRPNESEKPKNAENVEGACYW